MNLAAIALSAAIAASPASAAEGVAPVPPLKLRPKAGIATLAAAHRSAPFTNPQYEPELDLLPHEDARLEASRSSCSGERSLCYDPGSGRIVYKPARQLMPQIRGLQPENIAVRRDRIVFRYSFK